MAQDETLKVELTPEEKEEARVKAEATVAEWFDAAAKLAVLKEQEMNLRNEVVRYYFPNGLKEGTNKADLPEGWGMTVTGVINRKIDVAVKDAVHAQLVEEFQFDSGEAIKYKPELDVPVYRLMQKAVIETTGDNQEKARRFLKLFESMLIVTDGSPQVKLTEPKKPKAKVSTV